MRIAVETGSCLSSGLSSSREDNVASSIILADTPFHRGGSQGTIYEVKEIDGHAKSGLLVKLFINQVPSNLREIVSVLQMRKNQARKCHSLRGLPLFLLDGKSAQGPVHGYLMRRVPGKRFSETLDSDTELEEYINLSLTLRLRFCLQFTEGMSLLYSLNIVHADLNGQNLLIDCASGQLCIIDLDGGVVARTGSDPIVMGKAAAPEWIAPEIIAQLSRTTQRQNINVDIAADFWSI